MFTGIIGELGQVETVENGDEGARLRIRADLASELAPGDSVAVNGACLTATSRLGGHVVQGHVDGTGTVVSLEPEGFAKRLRVELPTELVPLVVERGSI